MDVKTKIIGIFLALLVFTTASTAYTAYYTNDADALSNLGKTVVLVPEKCKVIEVNKTIELGKEAKAQIVATFELPYSVNGEYIRRVGTIVLADASQAIVETETAKACDKLWLEIESEESKTIDKAIVEYTKGALSEMTTKAYDVVKKAWETVPTIGE